jgi:hypothetical protein
MVWGREEGERQRADSQKAAAHWDRRCPVPGFIQRPILTEDRKGREVLLENANAQHLPLSAEVLQVGGTKNADCLQPRGAVTRTAYALSLCRTPPTNATGTRCQRRCPP